MNMRELARWGAAVATCVAVVLPTPAQAEAEPPRFVDGFGLTVKVQPTWIDGAHRTFTFSVASTEVPRPTLLPTQVAGQHVVVVTLPEDYAGSAKRYPVLYALHGNPDMPDTRWNVDRAEIATQGKPLITVQPNGVRSWYSNWVNPGAVGKQNWESFHLDQLIPFVDANLRTIANRDGRAILGHSMGGFGALHYAEHRPELFGYVGSMSGGLDLRNPVMRGVVVTTELIEASGVPTVGADAIFGPPVWPFDGIWNAESPAHNVAPLRGMGVALYTGNGGNLLDNPVQAIAEQQARETNLVTVANLTAAGVPFDFLDYGDGSTWAPGCTGKHASPPCVQKAMTHFVGLVLGRLQHP
ncbi:alpha/beta hydrolase [Actinokineospora terrae]|uniref:S-formylglutathione hydrolase FrmB n=1 Tax=Actinokineospora terrae TaxID=155974 RepID=A0A1H9KBI2_9PSEU|nr:alpha/beta hydrolase-fold protein [Actinokineospora terrae]SEQ96520.1 S-formylglutathione hydrolase FrmB [Actinokineospora terrae]